MVSGNWDQCVLKAEELSYEDILLSQVLLNESLPAIFLVFSSWSQVVYPFEVQNWCDNWHSAFKSLTSDMQYSSISWCEWTFTSCFVWSWHQVSNSCHLSW